MLLAQIETFVEVARQQSISRAAEVLHYNQPTITARLQGLERELGQPLFERTKRGVRLTEAGRVFLDYAERVLALLREGRDRLDELSQATSGLLLLGASPAVSTYVLPAILKAFRARHPGVEVAVRTGHSEEVLDLVLKDEVRVGLVRAIRHPAIESFPLYEDELVLVTPPGHPFADQGEVTLEDMAREGLVMFDRTSSYHKITESLFERAGVEARIVMELDNIEAAKKMVEEGLGIALLPKVAVAREIDLGTVVEVPVAGGPPFRREVLVIQRKGAIGSGVVRAFTNLLREGSIPLPGLDGLGRRLPAASGG